MENQFILGIKKANEHIKILEDTASDDNQIISEIANLVAFFQNLSPFMSLSLINSKKKMAFTTRLPEIVLWVDIPTIHTETQNLIEVINQYLILLNSWSYETSDFEFLKAFHNIHFTFNKFLSLYYANKSNKLGFNKINPLKVIKNRSINNQSKYCIPTKFSSIFHISDINSILFSPTINSIIEFTDHFNLYKNADDNKANEREILFKIKNDLNKSYKELLFLLSDEKICNVFNQDFLENPRIDIIRENPHYQQYAIKMSTMFPHVQTEYAELNNSINSLFSRIRILNKLLKNSFALPQINFDELHRIIREETKYNIEKLKIMFLKKVCKEFNNVCPDFSYQPAALIKKINKKYSALSQTKDIDSIENQLKALRSELINSEFEKIFEEEEKKQASIQKEMDEKLRKLNTFEPPKPSHENELRIEELRKSVEKLSDTYKSQRTEMNNDTLQSIERHLTLFSKIQSKPVIPFEIEKMLRTLSDQAADFQWMNKRLERQKEENKAQEVKIQNMKDNLAKLKAEIIEKKKIIQNLKANNSSQKVPRKTASCLCSSCHLKQVECVIAGCGHTFCEACLKNTKNCPKCSHLISSNDVCKINWF